MRQPLSNRYPHRTRQSVNQLHHDRLIRSANNLALAIIGLSVGFALFA